MALSTLLVVACLTVPTDLPREAAWHAEVLLETEHGMGGAAIGDLDLTSPGNEVVVANAAGEVWMVRRVGDAWRPVRIHRGDGELIMCAIGDVDPRHAGEEFVGVGMVRGQESLSGAGQVVVIGRDGDDWIATQVFRDSHMIHGVAVGDVSARLPGNEIVACGFNHRVTLIAFDAGAWRSEVIHVGNDRMKIAAVADVLPERDGLEVVVAGSDGSVVLLWEGRLGWRHEIVYSDPVGQSRVACGPPGILIGGDLGKVTLAHRRDGRWTAEALARDSGKIRGVAIADVDEDVPGPELYACGYSQNLMRLTRDDDGFWRSMIVFTAKRPLHHLVAGDIDRAHPGSELVTCGHGGRLIALFPRLPGSTIGASWPMRPTMAFASPDRISISRQDDPRRARQIGVCGWKALYVYAIAVGAACFAASPDAQTGVTSLWRGSRRACR